MNVSSAAASGYGPKYVEPSWRMFRVLKRRGKSSWVILRTGYDFPSFKLMLYFGVYFLMRLFSRRKASYSFAVVMYSMLFALEISSLVLMSFLPEK